MPLLAGCSELSQTEGLSWRDVNSEKIGVGKRVFTGNTCGSLAWDTGTWQSVDLRDGTSRQPDSTSPQCVPAPAPCIIRLAIENRTRSNTVFEMVANSELLLCFAYHVALSRPNVTSCGTGLTVTSGSNSHTTKGRLFTRLLVLGSTSDPLPSYFACFMFVNTSRVERLALDPKR